METCGNRRSFKPLAGFVIAAACAVLARAAVAEPETEFAAASEFFEGEVRPLLAEHCFDCHGPEKQESGLRLDSRQSILAGGDSGAAAIVGAPAASLLIQAVNHHELKMPPPPRAKLSDAEIAALTKWVAMGLPWSPEVRLAKNSLGKVWQTHWAFQPIRGPSLPAVGQPEWVKTPVDHFVLARLEANDLSPSPEADRPTLIRRAYYDLIGLPPTYDQVEAFVKHTSPDAFEKLIEELLSRKEYGQRWGRHWLDVARYADSKGPIDGGEQRYAFSYTYRDYVIDAFNNDLPYDRFVLEQLAADQLDVGEHDPALRAMGFLTLGNKYYERIHEMIDDRIDVVARGLMALTMGCARCHSHKYDPIPTADYYSWYGVFRSSVEPYYFDKPLLQKPENRESPQWRKFIQEYREKEKDLKEFRREKHQAIMHEMRAFAADYLEYVAEEIPEHRTVAQFIRRTDRTQLRAATLHSEGGTFHWKEYINSSDANDPVFGIWHRLAALSRQELPTKSLETITTSRNINPLIRQALLQNPPRRLGDAARAIGRVLEQIYAEWKAVKEKDSQAARFDNPVKEELRQVLYGEDSPCVMTVEESRDYYHIGEHDKIRILQGAFERVFFDHANVAPPRALVMVDLPKPYEPYVFRRGDPKQKGSKVRRRFLQMMPYIDGGQPFSKGSGRLELARAIVHPKNPLTARVIVNRIWGWHFGKPLVGTPSDFGTRSAPPTHPDLLDYLATRLRDGEWSIKNLHRLIMLSATYQQESAYRPRPPAADPENHLLWRMNRQRLDFESFRDSVLAVAGRLNTRLEGPSTSDIFSPRRSVYLFINRQRLSSFYSIFDFPNPDLTTPQRVTTITPQQALFVMNHPLLLEASENVIERLQETTSDADAQERIRQLFRTIYWRDPVSEELAEGLRYLEAETDSEKVGQRQPLTPWVKLAHAMLQSNEFMFVE